MAAGTRTEPIDTFASVFQRAVGLASLAQLWNICQKREIVSNKILWDISKNERGTEIVSEALQLLVRHWNLVVRH